MKAVLVTGAGCDIGRETCLYFAAKGYKVFGHWRRENDSFRKTVQVLQEARIDLEPVFADLANTDEVGSMCDRILASGPELGAIVHIAGGSSGFGAHKITPQNIIDTMNVNLVSPMIMVHKLIPALAEGSVVISTSAMTGIHAGWYPTDACFDAAKGGTHRFTENLARELGPRTRVNTIVLGLSDVNDNYTGWRDSFKDKIPMRRIAQPDDYVRCVDFFVTHPYVTGVCLPLDGGWYSHHCAPPFPTATMVRS